MRTESSTAITAADGTQFRLVSWPSPVETDVVVVVHHGLGEHVGRYSSLATGLADAPVHVWGWDARGHGESGGKRGHADGLDQFVDDLEVLLPVVLERSGATHIVLYGHSMGAAVVGRYLTRRTPHAAIRGIWMSGAPVRIDVRSIEMRIKKVAARLLDPVLPSMTMANSIDSHSISSVPAEAQRYVDDPLVHDRLSVRLGLSLLRDGPQIVADADRIRSPIRLWHGADDVVAQPEGSRALFAAVGSEDKTLDVIMGARHEVHHETPAITEALFASLREWLAKRSPA